MYLLLNNEFVRDQMTSIPLEAGFFTEFQLKICKQILIWIEVHILHSSWSFCQCKKHTNVCRILERSTWRASNKCDSADFRAALVGLTAIVHPDDYERIRLAKLEKDAPFTHTQTVLAFERAFESLHIALAGDCE